MDTALNVMPGIDIPRSELVIVAIRASGPGGQHVNKTSTGISLRFDVTRSAALDDAQRQQILSFADRRISANGSIVIKADGFRSQAKNRADAETRLATLLREALASREPRKETRPSAAQKQRRKDDKAHRSRLKNLRKPIQD